MGFELKPQAMLTSKRPEMQHFRVVRGVCDVEGTISFESVHYPGSFLRVMTSKKIFMYPNSGHFSEKELCFYPRYDKYFDVRLLLCISLQVWKTLMTFIFFVFKLK